MALPKKKEALPPEQLSNTPEGEIPSAVAKTFSDIKNEEARPPMTSRMSESELPETRSMAIVKEFARPIVSVEEAQGAFAEYQKLVHALVTSKDLTPIKNKKTGEVKLTANKSAYNKLARFFGVSVEIIKEKQEMFPGKNQYGKPMSVLVAKTWVRATAPNGQFRVAGAACSSSEKDNWAHMYHDVFSLSETRATKRAIEGLVAAGDWELQEEESPRAASKIGSTDEIPDINTFLQE